MMSAYYGAYFIYLLRWKTYRAEDFAGYRWAVLLLHFAVIVAVKTLGFLDADIVQEAGGQHYIAIPALDLHNALGPISDRERMIDTTVIITEVRNE